MSYNSSPDSSVILELDAVSITVPPTFLSSADKSLIILILLAAFIFLSINIDSQSLQTLSSSSSVVIQPSFNIVSNSTRIANIFLPSSTPLLYNATIYSTQDVQTSIFKENSLASSMFSSNEANILQRSSSVTHGIAQYSLQQTSILSLQSLSNNKTDYLQQNASSTHNVEQTLFQQTSVLNSPSLGNDNSKHLSPIRTIFLQSSLDSSVRTNIRTNVPQNKTESLTTLGFRTALTSDVSQTEPVSHTAALFDPKIIGTQSPVLPVTSNVDQFSFPSLSMTRPSRSVTSNEANRTAITQSMFPQPQLASSVMYTSIESETISVNFDMRLSSFAQSVTAPLRTVVTKSQTVGNVSAKVISTIPAVEFSTSFQNSTTQLRSTLANSSSVVPQQSIATDRGSSILSSMRVVSSVDKAGSTSTVNLQTTTSMHTTSQSLLQSTFSFSKSKTAITTRQNSRNPSELSSLTQILSISMDTSNASQSVSRTPNNTFSLQDTPPTGGQILVTTNSLELESLTSRSIVYTNSYKVTSSVKTGDSKFATPSLVTIPVLQTSDSVGHQPGTLSTPTGSESSVIQSSSISDINSSSQHSTQDFVQRATTAAPPYQTLSVSSHLMPQSSSLVASDSQLLLMNSISPANLQTTTSGSLPDSSDEFRTITPSASVQTSLSTMSTDALYSKSAYSAFTSATNVRTSVVTSLSLGVKATPSVPVAESTVSNTLSSPRMKRSQNLPSELTTQPLGSAALSALTLEQSPILTTMLSKSEAKLQTTMETRSSQLPLTASTNEQRLFSSVYPCWIVNTVYMTIDASAIYPNQTLHTETVTQAEKSFDYTTQNSTFPTVSSQEALFTGITTQSVASVANGSSSMHGVTSKLEVVHESSTSSLSGLLEPKNSYTGAVTPTQSVPDERMVSSLSHRLPTVSSFFPQPSSSASQIATKSSLFNASPNSTTRAKTSVEPLMTTKASTGPTVYQRENQSVDSTLFKQSAGGRSSMVIGSMAVSSLTSTGKPLTASDDLLSTVDHQTSTSSLGGQSFPGITLGSTTATSTTVSLSEHFTSQISVNPTLKATLEAPQSTLNVAGDVFSSTSITAMSFRELPSLSMVIQASTMNPSRSAPVDTKVFMPSATYPTTTISSPGSAEFVQSQPLSGDVGQPTSLVKSEMSEISTFVNAPSIVSASVTKITALSDSKDQLSTTGSTMYTSNSAEMQQQFQSTVSSKQPTSEAGFPVSIALTLRHTAEVGSSQATTPNLTTTETHQMSNTATSTGLITDNSVTMTPSFKPPAGSATRNIDISAVSTIIAKTYANSNTVPVLQDTSLKSVESDKSITVAASLTLSAEKIAPRSSIFTTFGNIAEAPQISTFMPLVPIVTLTSVASNIIAASSLPIGSNLATSKQPQSSSISIVSSPLQAPEPAVIPTPVPLKKRKRRAVNGANDTSMISSNILTSVSLSDASLGSNGTFSAQEARSITPTTSQQSQLIMPTASSESDFSYSSNSAGKLSLVFADTARLLQSPDGTTSMQPIDNIGTTTSHFVDPIATKLSVSQKGVMQPTSTVIDTPDSAAVSPFSLIVSNKSISEALSATVRVNLGVVSMSVQESVSSSQASNFTAVSSVSTPILSQLPLVETNLQASSRFNSQTSSVSKPESNSYSLSAFELSKQVIDRSLNSDSSSIAASPNSITRSRTLLSSEVSSLSGLPSTYSQHSAVLSSAKSSGYEIPYSEGSVSSIGSQVKALATSIPQSLPSLVTDTVTTSANESSQNIAIATQRTMDSTPASQPSITLPMEMQQNTSVARPISIEVSSSLTTVEQASQSIVPGSTKISQSLGGSLTLTGGQTTSDTLEIGSSSNISSLLTTIPQSESLSTEMVPSSRVSSILPSVQASSPHMISQTATASLLTSSVGMISPNLSLSAPQFTTSNFDAFQSQGRPSTTVSRSTLSDLETPTPLLSTVEAGSKHTMVGFASLSSSISLKATTSIHETSDSIAIGRITSRLLSPSFMVESSQTSLLVSQSLSGNSPSRMMSSAISSSSPNLWTQNPHTTSQQSVVPTKSTTVVAYVTSSLGQCIAYYTPRLATPTLTRPSFVSHLTSRSVQETVFHTASTLLKSTPLVMSSPPPSHHVAVSSDLPLSVQTLHLTASSSNIIQLSPSLLASGMHPSTQLTMSYSTSRSVARSQVADFTSAVSQDVATSFLPVETQTASLSLTATIAASQAMSSASKKVGSSQSLTIQSLATDFSPSVSLSEMSRDSSTLGQDSVDSFTSISLSTFHVATAILPTTSYALQSVPVTITASQTLLQSSPTQVATPAISVGDSLLSTTQYFSASDVPIYETKSLSQFASSVTPSSLRREIMTHTTVASPSYYIATASQQVSTAISTSLGVSTFVQPHTSTGLLLKTSSGISSQISSKAPLQTSLISKPPASTSVFPSVAPTASSAKDVIAVSSSLAASSIASVTATSSFTPNAMTSQVPTSTPVVTTTQPVSLGLCDLVLIVAPAVDITTAAFKLDLETKLVETFNKIKLLRRRRAVTQAGTTVNVSISYYSVLLFNQRLIIITFLG